MNEILLKNPSPDFSELERVLMGKKEPAKVHLAELLIDDIVLQTIQEQYLGSPWIPLSEQTKDHYYQQLVTIYYRLGYDYVPIPQWPLLWLNHPASLSRSCDDTAGLSRGRREWVDETKGFISCDRELHQFPWNEIEPDYSALEITARYLPEGMKIIVSTNLFEHVYENLVGCEAIFYMLNDNPELLFHVFTRWGQKVYDFYRTVIEMESVGGIFHADDMGFTTSVLISPDDLRYYLFPWLERYAELAHRHGKMFWLHSCGNHYKPGTIEDLIDNVKIDAFHSFQDIILPVTEFKALYGNRVATLGGIDMDKFTRMEEKSLAKYIREILEKCMSGGRFALSSGNTIANYIPLRNFYVMLETSRCWR